MFKEIHYRVTNSLQLVHSALSIQLRTLGDSEARGQVAEAAARVLAIAAVHRAALPQEWIGGGRRRPATRARRAALDDREALDAGVSDRRLDLEMQSFSGYRPTSSRISA